MDTPESANQLSPAEMDHTSARHYGFSLIELLVVMAVLAVLATILLSTISRVRAAGEAASCASNLRQIGAAFLIYVSENNGELPTEHSTDEEKESGNEWYYPNELAKYIPPEKWAVERQGNMRGGVWQCPSLDDKDLSWGGGYGTNRSHVILPMASDGVKAVRLSQIQRPAKVVFIGDVWYRSRKASWISMQCPECRTWGNTTEANPVHRGKANMCFLDGHVELLAYEDLAANKNDMFGHHQL